MQYDSIWDALKIPVLICVITLIVLIGIYVALDGPTNVLRCSCDCLGLTP